MSFIRNKHVAVLSVPVLAFIGYFMVDQLLEEESRSPIEGQAYPLVAKSNCRYSSGECDLVNTSFQSTLMVRKSQDSTTLILDSSHALQGVKVGFADVTVDESFSDPVEMRASSNTSRKWAVKMPMDANETTRVMVVMLADGAHYYAQTTMGFSEYSASYKKDFRAKSHAVEKQ